MIPDGFFCAASARSRSETLYGTAPRVDTWLLLEHPGAWSGRACPDDRLPADVRQHFRKLKQHLPSARRLLIRQGHTLRERLRFFVARSLEHESYTVRFDLVAYEDLLRVDAAFLQEPAPARVWPEPLYLVCTHGTHDKCCAKFGVAACQALCRAAPEPAWECSHVGGDRFAANLVFLPDGIYYGHVVPDSVPALIEAHRQRRIALAHYRGRSCYTRVAQVGEYFIRAESGVLGIDELQFLDAAALDERRWSVRFRSRDGRRDHRAEFRIRDGESSARLTCKAIAAQPIRTYELASYTEEKR
jgi:hypothetical protein